MYPIAKMLIKKQRNAATNSNITVMWSMYIPKPNDLVVLMSPFSRLAVFSHVKE